MFLDTRKNQRITYKFIGYVQRQSNKKFELSQVMNIICFHPSIMITKLIYLRNRPLKWFDHSRLKTIVLYAKSITILQYLYIRLSLTKGMQLWLFDSCPKY